MNTIATYAINCQHPCRSADSRLGAGLLTGLLLLAWSAEAEAQFAWTTNQNGTMSITAYTGPGGAVVIPSTIGGQPVTRIGDRAFAQDTNLTSVSIPSGVTQIGVGTFSDCTSLASVTIPENVTKIDPTAFDGCAHLTNFTVSTLNSTYSSLDGVLFNHDQSRLILFPRGNGGDYIVPESAITIADSAFSGCTGLTSVVMSGGLINIASSAFANCAGLTNVILLDGLTAIGRAVFQGCSALTSVRIPRNLTFIGQSAFAGCAGLTNFSVDPLNPAFSAPDGVLFDNRNRALMAYPAAKPGGYAVPAGITAINSDLFSGCTGLTGITLPESLTVIGMNAFNGCTSLTSINVDSLNHTFSSLDGVLIDKTQGAILIYPPGKAGGYTVPGTVSQISGNAFYACAGLTSLTVPSSVIEISTAIFDPWPSAQTFAGCTSLTNITVDPANPNYSSVDGVLFNKTQDTLITCPGGKRGAYLVPNSVTSIERVAFTGCAQLTEVTINKSVTSIGFWAFHGCIRLGGIYFLGDAPPDVDAVTLDDDNVTIYYSPGTAGWGPLLDGRPVLPWQPRIQSGAPGFGLRSNGFGFNISWIPNTSVVVEASSHLTGSPWVSLQALTLTNGSASFNDPHSTDYPTRFYRIRQPAGGN
jgi:hypothetical protein